MSNYRVAVIGCGKISVMHTVSLLKQDNVDLVAVCDIKKDRADATALRCNCKAYYDYKEMIERENLDSVHVCTPHYLHPEMVIYALSKGLHVLTEKPMAINYEDAVKMAEAAEKANRHLLVSFQDRFNPGSLLIKDTLESGKLGRIISARAMVTWDRSDEYYSHSDWKGTWDKEGGGVIIDQAIHTLDLMNWFIDSPIKEVNAAIDNRCHDIIKVEDSAEGLIRYQNGVNACFFAINYYGYDAPVEIELFCEKGIVKLVGERASIKFNDGSEAIADRNPTEFFEFGDVKQYWGVGHMKEITYFYSHLDDKELKNSAESVLDSHKLIFSIYKSGKERKAIKF